MKKITNGQDARVALQAGINELAQAVKVTMGPRGKNVLIQKKVGKPVLTKDGVSVAEAVNFKDPVKNMGAQLVKEAAQNTAQDAGDGTTTATVLASEIFSNGLQQVQAGANAVQLKLGMDKAKDLIIKNLRKQSKPVTTTLETEQVATISANGDTEIGKMISDAINKVGTDGVITVEEAKGISDELVVVEGMQFDRGYLSPYFVTDTSKLTCTLENTYVLLYNKKIMDLKEILPALEKVQTDKKSLLIICDDIESEPLNTLVINSVRKVLNVCVIKAPGFNDTRIDYLEDIAILTGGIVINETTSVPMQDTLGYCSKVEITKQDCTLITDTQDSPELLERVKNIKEQLQTETEDYFKAVLKSRLAKLTGGIAVVKVSAATDTETKEKRDRVDDALGATKAAQEEGIIQGGGCALVNAKFCIDELYLEGDIKIGAQIVLDSISKPLLQIAENAGYNGGIVQEKISSKLGFDANTGNYVDMFDKGIIDSLKVCRIALTNAVSVSSMLLTTESVISIEEEV